MGMSGQFVEHANGQMEGEREESNLKTLEEGAAPAIMSDCGSRNTSFAD
jgi:hypothetical protein